MNHSISYWIMTSSLNSHGEVFRMRLKWVCERKIQERRKLTGIFLSAMEKIFMRGIKWSSEDKNNLDNTLRRFHARDDENFCLNTIKKFAVQVNNKIVTKKRRNKDVIQSSTWPYKILTVFFFYSVMLHVSYSSRIASSVHWHKIGLNGLQNLTSRLFIQLL